MNIADCVVIKLLPGGYFLELAVADQGLTIEGLRSYVAGLRIPDVQMDAIDRAFASPRGQALLLAPPPGAAGPPKAKPPEKNNAPQCLPPRAVRWQKPSPRPLTPIKQAQAVLIVDMLPNMVRTFEAAFAGAKVEILYANLPNLYFSTIANRIPDLILLAAQLGKIDGSLLAARIRTDGRTARIPLVMYSSVRPRHEIIRAFDSGITDYLVMPVDIQAFRSKINKALIQVGKCIVPPVSESRKPAGEPGPLPGAAGEKIEPVAPPRLADLLRKVKDMLAVPHILAKVLNIVEDDRASSLQLSRTIESDAATVAIVLRKANTVFYGKGQPISDIKEAVLRIGSNEVKSLVLSLNAIKMFSKGQKSNGFSRLDFWKHTLATGIIGKILAQQLKLATPDDLFVGGLLHDIGKIVLDEYAVPPFDDIVMQAIDRRSPLRVEEKKTLGYTHVEVGMAVLEEWKFPDYLQVIVARHHQPESQKKETCKTQHLVMARLVHIANLLAKALGVGSGGDLSIEELPAADWMQTLYSIRFEEQEMARFNKEIEEVGSLLEVGGALCESVGALPEQLPEIILLDPLKKARVLSVIKIHLTAMGYPVQYVAGAEELPGRSEDKRYAMCCLLEKYDSIQMFLLKLAWHLPDWNFPLVVVLPQSEKQYQVDNALPERPLFLKDNQTLLFEPFDVEQLHDALGGQCNGNL